MLNYESKNGRGKEIKKVGLLLFLGLILSSCAGLKKLDPNYISNSWLWSNESDLIAQWGTPDRIVPLEDGKKVLVYRRTLYSYTTPGQAYTSGSTLNSSILTTGSATTTYTPPETHGWGDDYYYWIDGAGIIYKASYQYWSQ